MSLVDHRKAQGIRLAVPVGTPGPVFENRQDGEERVLAAPASAGLAAVLTRTGASRLWVLPQEGAEQLSTLSGEVVEDAAIVVGIEQPAD